jgi:hypothetical protein
MYMNGEPDIEGGVESINPHQSQNFQAYGESSKPVQMSDIQQIENFE